MTGITRRELLRRAAQSALGAAALGLGAADLVGCRSGGAIETLVVQGAAAPPSLALLRVAGQGVPPALARGTRFQVWYTVDEMRARIASSQAHYSGVPVNVAATLYNRGVHVQLLNVYIWGILYLVTADPQASSFQDLRGQTVLIPFRGDLPDILTQYLLRRQGLDLARDLAPSYQGTAPEAAQLLAAGRATHAVLSEPAATLAILKAKQNGITLRRAIDYSQAWAAATGHAPRLPMAGVVAAPQLARAHAGLLAWFQAAFREAVAWVMAHPQEASQLGAEEIKAIPPAVMAAALPYIQFDFTSAREAREEVEFFLSEMHSLSPELIGGRLPPDEFYYRD